MEAVLKRSGPLLGAHTVPGDKSISHRAALFGALAEGTTTIENFVRNRDCEATLDCAAALGATVDRSGPVVTISGGGREALRAPSAPLDCLNSGTTFRLMM